MQTQEPKPFNGSINNAVVILSAAVMDGGGTFHRYYRGTQGPDLTGKLVVGGKVKGLVIELGGIDRHTSIIDPGVRQAEHTIARWLDTLPTNVEFVGSWVEDGKLYVDAVDLLDTHAEAWRLTVERGELAYYDADNSVSVYVTPNEPDFVAGMIDQLDARDIEVRTGLATPFVPPYSGTDYKS